jgi:hypothetical protein
MKPFMAKSLFFRRKNTKNTNDDTADRLYAQVSTNPRARIMELTDCTILEITPWRG